MKKNQYLYVRNNKFWRSKLCIHLANVFPMLIFSVFLLCCMRSRSLIFFRSSLFSFTIYVVVCVWLRNSISIASIWQQSNEHTNKQTNKRYQKLFQSFQFVLNTKHYNFSYILLLPSPFSHKNRFVVKYDIVLQSLCPLFWLEMAARVNIYWMNGWIEMDRHERTRTVIIFANENQ